MGAPLKRENLVPIYQKLDFLRYKITNMSHITPWSNGGLQCETYLDLSVSFAAFDDVLSLCFDLSLSASANFEVISSRVEQPRGKAKVAGTVSPRCGPIPQQPWRKACIFVRREQYPGWDNTQM
jgi:hypothetical protein